MSEKHTHSHGHHSSKISSHQWKEKSVNTMPLDVQLALRNAMRTEKIPATNFNDLLWILAQEAGGHIDARNKKSTARGLFNFYPRNIV